MDHGILERLFAEHYNGALLYALSLAKDRALAEDLVSNAFFKALTARHNEEASFKSWLFTVIRNEHTSYHRRYRRQAELSDSLQDEDESLLAELIKDEEYRALYHAISLLPEGYREVITLFYVEELSVREIARVTKKGEGLVKTTLCRARIKLKEILEGS